MKTLVEYILMISSLGLSSNCYSMYESKEALLSILGERGIQYVVETKNNVPLLSPTPSFKVTDLQTNIAHPINTQRLPEMDYIVTVNKFRQFIYGSVLAKAYNISNVMVCYYFDDTVIYKSKETCMLFPHPVNEVVDALSKGPKLSDN